MSSANSGGCRSALEAGKLVDLTHSLDEHSIPWPSDPPFSWKAESWGRTGDGDWYAAGFFSTPEHIGTHIDAPIHFAEGGMRVGEIPLDRLVAPALVVDIRDACSRDRDYCLGAEDLVGWQERCGAIGRGEIVLVRTGWSRHWPDRGAYLGTDRPDDEGGMSFPGIGVEAAVMLRDCRVSGVGIDTAGVDYGKSKDFAVHKILNGAGIFHLENLTSLEHLPETGFTLIALPLKLANGSGAPARVVAVLP